MIAPQAPVTVACSGLDVTFHPFSGKLDLGESDRVRICVPDAGAGSVTRADAPAPLPIRFPEICVVPQARPCELALDATRNMMVFSLDPAYCDDHAMKQYGSRFRIQDYFVTNDPFIRRMGETLGVAMRQQQMPGPDVLSPLARDLAKHVATTYGKPSGVRKRGGLSPDRVARVMKLIDQDLATSLTTAQLAAEVHLSEFHFCRMFRQSTGYSPHAYLTLRRMDRARELLETTDQPLRGIAEAVGYKTHAHFTCVFHAYCGTTPAAYRRAKRVEGAVPA